MRNLKRLRDWKKFLINRVCLTHNKTGVNILNLSFDENDELQGKFYPCCDKFKKEITDFVKGQFKIVE